MYSKHVGPYEAAYRHLKGMRPLEPEMALSLTSKKISWSKSRTKNVTVHTMKLKEPKSYEKYLKRIPECEDFSYKQWLRDFNDAPNNPKSYKGRNTLLGTKTRSVFCDDYFYQDLVLNHPHRQRSDLLHPDSERLPDQIKHFAAAINFRSEFWRDEDKLRSTEANDDIPEANLGVLDDDSSDETEDVDEYEQNLASATGIDWKKFLLVQGKP
ncbi:unnamed protein product, partial [Porites evermanni]